MLQSSPYSCIITDKFEGQLLALVILIPGSVGGSHRLPRRSNTLHDDLMQTYRDEDGVCFAQVHVMLAGEHADTSMSRRRQVVCTKM